jgi:peptidoglycan/xylan/chitin deacetylase (PgdA/CDA1 family)
MTVFLIRDDDPNATTDPEQLERTYAPLLDAGLRIAFSVIPRIALDTRDPEGARERFIHPAWRDAPDEVLLTPGAPLSAWLRAHEGEVDVMMHGLSHRRIRGGTELGALTREEADARFVQGRDILCTALGRAPLGVVAPWDAYSRGSLLAATDRFSLVSTGYVDRARLPPEAWPSHVLERISRRETLRVNGAWVVRHRGGRFDGRTRPEDVPRLLAELAKDAEVAVIVLHHWMFWGGPTPHPVVVALADALRKARAPVRGVADIVTQLDERSANGLRARLGAAVISATLAGYT